MMTNENVGFDFISDRYKIKYTEPLYESEIRTEFWYVNWYMGTGISNWHF